MTTALSVRAGKFIADAELSKSLYEQAVGFTRKVKKIVVVMGQPETMEYEEYFPPSTTAAIFWLKNCDKKHWRDKQDVEHNGEIGLAALFKKLDGKANKLSEPKD